MTTWTKWLVCLLVVVALVWWMRDPRVAPPDANEVAAAQSQELDEAVAATGPHRVSVTPDAEPEQAFPTVIEVHVRHDETGAVVSGASVLFVTPGFAYADLTPEKKDQYSRTSESYLRAFGESRVTDENGITRIPIEAVNNVVVARKGTLYGTKGSWSGGTTLEILVSAHHTLVVETADALGNPVPRVKVVGQPAFTPASPFTSMSKWTLGTTNEHGTLTYVLKPPSGDASEQIWLEAELLDGAHGRETIDLRAPPSFVRLTLPATGIVRAKTTNADGVLLDRQILESLRAELSIAGVTPRAGQLGGWSGRLFDRFDAEGNACFENIVLGKTLRLRFPGMVLDPKVFPGPSTDELVVTIVQTVEPDHPFVVGTLVGPESNPVVSKRFAIFCRQEGDLLASVGGETDERGRFKAYLSDACMDKSSVVFTLGMEMSGVGYDREARVPIAYALRGTVDLGEVVMPEK